MNKIKNKLFRWYGGKGTIHKKIVPYLNTSYRVYVEPFCGGASVFFAKEIRNEIEVLNDLDVEVMNFYRVLQDNEKGKELIRRLEWSMYARKEFMDGYTMLNCGIRQREDISDVDRAFSFYVVQKQIFAGRHYSLADFGSWGRYVSELVDFNLIFSLDIKKLSSAIERLQGVCLENRDGILCIEEWDSSDVLFYVDPPYIIETRKDKKLKAYSNELDDRYHERLVEVLLRIKGKVILSGYHHDMYDKLVSCGWKRIRINTTSNAAGRIRTSKIRGFGNATKHARREENVYMNF